VRTSVELFATFLLLTGCCRFRCYTPPPYPPCAVEAQLDAAQPDAFSTQRAPVMDWWNEFEDPCLAGLVEQGLQNNLDLHVAYANLSEARAIARRTCYDRYPTVTADASYNRQLNSLETFTGTLTPRWQDLYEAGFDARWELDFLGRVSQRIATENRRVQAAFADVEQVYVSVSAEVARTYMELRGAQHELGIAESNAANQENTYELTVKLMNGGRATALDVSRSITQVKLTRSLIPPLKARITSAIHRLSVLTGQVPDALQNQLATTRPLPTLPATVFVGDAAGLLRRRPDIRAAERTLASRVAQYNVSVTDLFPVVNIIGSIGFMATNLGSFGTSALAGAIGPSLTWRAFDLGRVYAQIAEEDARTRAALANYERTVLLALEETQTALDNFAREEERRLTLQEAAQSAADSTRLAQQRFDVGLDDFLDVLDAQRTQLGAEESLAQSETKAATSLVAIYKALGGGWCIDPCQPALPASREAFLGTVERK